MSNEAITWAYKTTVGSSAQKAVLLVLANYADENDSAYPGIPRIAKMTQLSERTVQRAIAEMEESGVIRVERGVNKTNRYYINTGWCHSVTTTGDTVTGGGVTVSSNTKKTPEGDTKNPMPAAARRVEPERTARAPRKQRPAVDDGEGLGRTGSLPDDGPQPEEPRRGPTIGGLAKDFEREARTRYPKGDPRRVTNLTALRANISRWKNQDGVELSAVEATMAAFWADADRLVKPDGEPWRRFLNLFARLHAKASAPDITNPDYYTDQQEENDMDDAAQWIKEQGL